MADKQPEQPERPAKKVKFSPQVSVSEFHAIPAQEAVTFHLLFGATAAELDSEMQQGRATGSSNSFACEFYNQVFGESEELNGYKGLQVHVWLALRSGHCWVDISYADRQPGADDVGALLAEWWPRGFTTDRAEFLQQASAAPDHDFATVGRLLDGSITQGVGVAEGSLQLYHAKLADTPEWFKELHVRLEPLLIFTIDGANFLDADDPKWEVVAAVVQRDGRSYLAGFMTVYNFFAWPDSQRPRVAQVLVLPPLQQYGFGRALVSAAYYLARERDAVDLTFEDPSPGLQLLREKLELEMLAACSWATQHAQAALGAATAVLKQQPQPPEAGGKGEGHDAAAAVLTSAAAAGVPDAGAGPSSNGTSNGAAAAAQATATGPQQPVDHLVLPPALHQRITKELKIHKHQVSQVWEALLFLTSRLCERGGSPLDVAEAALQEVALTDLITRRLRGNMDKAAHTKKLVQVAGDNDDFFVYKLPGKRQQSPQQQGEEAVSVGRNAVNKVSADEYSEQLQQQVSNRMETLAMLKRRVLARQQAGPEQQQQKQRKPAVWL